MEAVRDFIDLPGPERGTDRGTERGAQPGVSGVAAVDEALYVLQDVRSTAVDDAVCASGGAPAAALRPVSGLANNVGALWQSDSMEAVRDFMDLQGTDRGTGRGTERGAARPAQPRVPGASAADEARDGLQDDSSTAVDDAVCASGGAPAATLRPVSGPANPVGGLWQSGSMEAVRDFMDLQDTDRGVERGTGCGTARPGQPRESGVCGASGVDEARDGLQDVSSTAVDDAMCASG
ncbi:hypothetical protein, partial [Arthrobacter sp. PsM3]|uniref:hypothetical protein n=1 Tax=Arthrobacter sp. PsM3 TaxID=3030531 RepID=UPI00263A7293